MDEAKPRLTPEEADARFAALVEQHRQQNPRRRRRLRGPDPVSVALAMYVAGVAIGAKWHDHVVRALVLGFVGWAVWAIVRKTVPADE